MRRVALLVSGLWLLGTGLAYAQALPEGTFASEQDGCAKLEAKTPAELGEDLDFQVLTKKGLTAYQQTCDFVNVFGHDATSWVATAFCDEGGYTYPDLFSIKQRENGTLNVTRITDLTEQGSDELTSDSDFGKPGATEPPGGNGVPTDEQGASKSYSSFVKCQHVKP